MKTRLPVGLFWFVFTLLVVGTAGSAYAKLGEDGVNGMNGPFPSGDGEPGTDGGDAIENVLSGDAQNNAFALGGRGGHGGNDGMGDLLFSPDGGNGGEAGDAGNAFAAAGDEKSLVGPVNVTVTAIGGGDTTGRLLVSQSAFGGSGGVSLHGTPGKGGTAVYVTADPLRADVLGALRDNPTAHEDFDVGGASQMLAMVSRGSSYPLDGSGLLKTMVTNFSQSLNLSGVTVLQDLMVALVNPEVTGSFISLQFRITFDGLPLVNQTFTDIASLNSFFDDRSLNLGALSPTSNGKTLGVSFEFRSRTPGSGFSTQLAFGNSTPGIGPTVPEPATLLLFGIALFSCPNPRRRPLT